MSIWSAEIKELERLYVSFKGQFPQLEKELGQLIHFDDPNVILLYSRRCLEVIITDLCECELKRPRKTEPLKGIIDKLHKEEKVPSNIITSMDHLNGLSAYGAHPKDFDPEQVKPVLVNLDIIIKWYLKYKNIQIKKQPGEKMQGREELLEDVQKEERIEKLEKYDRLTKNKLLYGVLIITILIIAAIIAYPKIFKRDTLERLRTSGERISVAVMPFQNMTNDTVWNVWQDGIQDILITYLSNSTEELTVKQPEAISYLIQSKDLVNYASLTPSIASKISQKLEANVFVYGSIIKAGFTLRLNAQLIDSNTEEAFKSFEVEGPAGEESIFQITDSLKQMVRNFLMLSVLEKDVPAPYGFSNITDSPEAFRYFIYGNKFLWNRDYSTAIDWYLKSLAADSTFDYAASYLSVAYSLQGSFDQGKKWILYIYERRDQMPLNIKTIVDWTYARYFETPQEQIKCLNQYLEIDDQNAFFSWLLGQAYSVLNQFDKAIPAYEKSLGLYEKWDVRPAWIYNYTTLGIAYHTTDQFRKEKKLYKKAEHDFPGDHLLIYRQAILALSEDRTKQADKYIEKYVPARKERPATDAAIANNLAGIYEEAEILDKSEEYYRKALSLEPENPLRLNSLAWFLIDNDRNINEGIELVNRALELSPDVYYMVDTKGWGLYKQGRYQEALELLEKSWDLYPIYNHKVYLHLEATKKAVAELKNNQ